MNYLHLTHDRHNRILSYILSDSATLSYPVYYCRYTQNYDCDFYNPFSNNHNKLTIHPSLSPLNKVHPAFTCRTSMNIFPRIRILFFINKRRNTVLIFVATDNIHTSQLPIFQTVRYIIIVHPHFTPIVWNFLLCFFR